MDSLIRRAVVICATLNFAAFAPSAGAQQAPPVPAQQDSTAGVAPAPPPQPRSTHRWVNTGGYLTPEPRRKASAPKASGRPAVHARVRSKPSVQATVRTKKAQRESKHESRAVKSLTKAELRRCKSLSHRQLLRNSNCKAALQAEKKPEVRKAKAAEVLSKAEQRRCQKMSYSQLLRNRDCAAQLQRELDARESKHASRSKKVSSSRQKRAVKASSRVQKSRRRH